MRLHTLERCMSIMSPSAAGKGLCFHYAAALVLDLDGSELVIGTFRAATASELVVNPNWSPEPFTHCWVEWQGMILAPTLIERMGGRLVPLPLVDYYAKNGASNIKRLTRAEVQVMHLELHLTMGQRIDPPLADRLADAARYRYKVSERGTMLPDG